MRKSRLCGYRKWRWISVVGVNGNYFLIGLGFFFLVKRSIDVSWEWLWGRRFEKWGESMNCYVRRIEEWINFGNMMGG